MAVLTSKKRAKLKTQSFAMPKERKYPIHDKAHAIAAVARVKQHGTPAQQRRVIAAVKRKYPGLPMFSGQDESILGTGSGLPGGHVGHGM
jgi:hypothetical protein